MAEHIATGENTRKIQRAIEMHRLNKVQIQSYPQVIPNNPMKNIHQLGCIDLGNLVWRA